MSKSLKLITCICLIAIGSFSQAQDLSPTFLAIIVSDMDSSIAWYQQKLGFEVVNQTANEARGFKQANLKTASTKLELIEIKNAVNPSDSIKSPLIGLFKFGFTTQKFDWWIEHLEQQAAHFHGRVVPDPHSGKRLVLVKDPDGNRIQIFEQ
ncbi:MAG: VOC family protein [Fulvivirga sp.]